MKLKEMEVKNAEESVCVENEIEKLKMKRHNNSHRDKASGKTRDV